MASHSRSSVIVSNRVVPVSTVACVLPAGGDVLAFCAGVTGAAGARDWRPWQDVAGEQRAWTDAARARPAGCSGVRILLKPTWAKLIDFDETLPTPLEELVRRWEERQ